MITCKNNIIEVKTSTLCARIEKGFITSLKSRQDEEEFIAPFDVTGGAAVQLVYRDKECVRIDESKFGEITVCPVSDTRAEMVIHCFDGDGVVGISEDEETGDLIVEPAAYSSRPGVLSVRWTLKGLGNDLQLILPHAQGMDVKLDSPYMHNRTFEWPKMWEAGLVILHRKSAGFMVHAQDAQYRYKALRTGDPADRFSLGFDTQAYGPVDNNLASGGLAWRINVFKGDWRVPAGRYRDWLWKAYDLEKEERRRKPWLGDLKMAVCWVRPDCALLDALAQRVDPSRVLFHMSQWRSDNYDSNYPEYNASPEARTFIGKCQNMGFHVAPHCNSLEIDPTHPCQPYLRDFMMRHVDTKYIDGWTWYQNKPGGVANSNAALLTHRDKLQMTKIHPGLSMWRHLLGQKISSAAKDLGLEAIFVDVTLVSLNLHNCFVENMTSSEGMNRLIHHVARLHSGLVVGGEGRNEIIMQGLSFAQMHLFWAEQKTYDDWANVPGIPLNEFLFGRLCRGIGYSGLSGGTPEQQGRFELYDKLGAIPTITVRSAEDILKPNKDVEKVLANAT